MDMGDTESTASIDIAQVIDGRAMSVLQWVVAAACAFTMFTNGYDLQVLALTVPSLAQEWTLDPSSFGAALASANVGIVLAATCLAPLGDRFGRRTLLMVALSLGGIATLATATAGSPFGFAFWRLLTGIGVGMNIPNANAWTSEYSPARARATYLVLMNAAIAAGSVVAGVIAPTILVTWGWRGTFIIGGVAPLLTAAVIYFVTPESLKFLLARRPQDARIATILKRIAPEFDAARLRRPDLERRQPNATVFALLQSPFRARTLVLWTIMLVNLFTMYVLISWLPTLLQSAGWSLDSAVRGAVLIPAGGVAGGMLLSFFLNRKQTKSALLSAYLLSGVCLALFEIVPSGPAWTLMLLIIGGGISGSQLALNALSTAYYPAAIKATGMSWVGVVGNVGSIIAPFYGGWLIARGVPSIHILALLCIPAAACAACTLAMRREWQSE
jgi:AAHS family 4-hydroxybenzoate transporter-like MFS transporter